MARLKGALSRLRQPGALASAMAEARGAEPEQVPFTDESAMYPELTGLRRVAAAGDWAGTQAVLDGFAEGDRAQAADALVDVPGTEAMLGRAVAADPADLRAAALLAARTVVLGWEVRGAGRASTVTRGQFDVFHEHLRRAEAAFLDVLAHDPGQPDALRWRLTSGRGLGVGSGEVRRRYEQAAARLPHDFSLQASMLQQLCPKWGGSWAEAYEFAVGCAESAPPGSPNASLLAEYHIERWLDADPEDATDYFRGGCHAEIVHAAEFSVLHSDYRARIGWVRTHGDFAMCFSMADDDVRAHEQFTALDNLMSERPWAYFDDPVRTYTTFRRVARSAAERGL